MPGLARLVSLSILALVLAACSARTPQPAYLPYLQSNTPPSVFAAGSQKDEPDKPDRALVRRFNREIDRLLKDAPPDPQAPAQLFERYDLRRGSEWASNWTSQLDLTGIAWNGDRAGVLITRQHILFAKHWPRRDREWAIFHAKDGQAHWRKVVARRFIGKGRTDDLAVGLLDRPVPEHIKVYKLFPPGSFPGYTLLGSRAILTNRNREAVLREVNSILRGYPGGDPAHLVRFREAARIPAALQPPLIEGDSGHPGFLLLNGEPILLETLTYGGFGRGPSLTDPEYQQAILEAVRELGPEPIENLLPYGQPPETQRVVR